MTRTELIRRLLNKRGIRLTSAQAPRPWFDREKAKESYRRSIRQGQAMTDNTVWAISSGQYSDYSVVYICDSKEQAEKFVAELNNNDDEDYYADYFVEELQRLPKGAFTQKTLRISETLGIDGTPGRFPAHHFIDNNVYTKPPPVVKWVYICHNNEWGTLCVEGQDFARVRKVFSDKRAELLANPHMLYVKHMEGGK